jgi:hypothetical protein
MISVCEDANHLQQESNGSNTDHNDLIFAHGQHLPFLRPAGVSSACSPYPKILYVLSFSEARGTKFFLYRHIDGDHNAFNTPRQDQSDLDRDGLMRRPVRVGLVVVGVRPEGEAVLDGVTGMQRAGVRPGPVYVEPWSEPSERAKSV